MQLKLQEPPTLAVAGEAAAPSKLQVRSRSSSVDFDVLPTSNKHRQCLKLDTSNGVAEFFLFYMTRIDIVNLLDWWTSQVGQARARFV